MVEGKSRLFSRACDVMMESRFEVLEVEWVQKVSASNHRASHEVGMCLP